MHLQVGFFLFSKHFREETKKGLPAGSAVTEVAKALGVAWKKLPEVLTPPQTLPPLLRRFACLTSSRRTPTLPCFLFTCRYIKALTWYTILDIRRPSRPRGRLAPSPSKRLHKIKRKGPSSRARARVCLLVDVHVDLRRRIKTCSRESAH